VTITLRRIRDELIPREAGEFVGRLEEFELPGGNGTACLQIVKINGRQKAYGVFLITENIHDGTLDIAPAAWAYTSNGAREQIGKYLAKVEAAKVPESSTEEVEA